MRIANTTWLQRRGMIASIQATGKPMTTAIRVTRPETRKVLRKILQVGRGAEELGVVLQPELGLGHAAQEQCHYRKNEEGENEEERRDRVGEAAWLGVADGRAGGRG